MKQRIELIEEQLDDLKDDGIEVDKDAFLAVFNIGYTCFWKEETRAVS